MGDTSSSQPLPVGVPQSELLTIYKKKSRELTLEEQRIIQIKKNKILSLANLKEHQPDMYEDFLDLLKCAGLVKFVTATPKLFHPYLVAEFYRRAIVASDEESFSTDVYGTKLTISAGFLSEMFELSSDGIRVSTYLDEAMKPEHDHWVQWKDPAYNHKFKSATPKGSLKLFYQYLLLVANKMIVCDIGSVSELSERKYKPMMVLADKVKANWAEYIFRRLLVNVNRNSRVEQTKLFELDVHFGLVISYILEKKMERIVGGEELVSSDFIPSRVRRKITRSQSAGSHDLEVLDSSTKKEHSEGDLNKVVGEEVSHSSAQSAEPLTAVFPTHASTSHQITYQSSDFGLTLTGAAPKPLVPVPAAPPSAADQAMLLMAKVLATMQHDNASILHEVGALKETFSTSFQSLRQDISFLTDAVIHKGKDEQKRKEKEKEQELEDRKRRRQEAERKEKRRKINMVKHLK